MDADIGYIIDQIKMDRQVLATLICKRYYQVWAKGQLEVEDDILYQCEYPKVMRIRQLR